MEEKENKETVENTQEVAEEQPVLNEQKLAMYFESLKSEQNLPMSIVGSAIASVIGAGLWALITVVTEFQIGYMAIAVGFIVGFGNRLMGKGIDQIFGIIGAAFAILGCFVGNYLSVVGFVANAYDSTFMETLGSIETSAIFEFMAEDFGLYDILFYGIALYTGYKFSFRQIDEDEIVANAQ